MVGLIEILYCVYKYCNIPIVLTTDQSYQGSSPAFCSVLNKLFPLTNMFAELWKTLRVNIFDKMEWI